MKNAFQKICVLSLTIATVLLSTACSFDNVQELGAPTVIAYSEQSTPELLESADVITIDYQNLQDIEDCAKALVDDGKIICIYAPEASNEEIADRLSIPRNAEYAYNPYVLAATYIYEVAGSYVIGNDWLIPAVVATTNIAEDIIPTVDNTPCSFDTITFFSDASFDAKNTIAIQNNPVENAIDCAKDNMEKYATVNPSGEIMPLSVPTIDSNTKIFVGSAQVIIETGKVIGNCAATQYVYPIGYRDVVVDNVEKNMYVYSVVTNFSATPDKNYYCTGFTGRMKCNTSDAMLEHVNITGSDNSTITLSFGYSQNPGATMGVFWAYNKYGYKHTTTYAGTNAYDYKISASILNNSELNLTPGICVGTIASAGNRSNYSEMIVPASCFAVASSAVSFTVGGKF